MGNRRGSRLITGLLAGGLCLLVLASLGCQTGGAGAYRPRRPWEAAGVGRLSQDAVVAVYTGPSDFLSLASHPEALAFAAPGRELNHIFVYFCNVQAGGRLSSPTSGLADARLAGAARWAQRRGVEVHLVVGGVGAGGTSLASPETRGRLKDAILELAAAAPRGVTGVQLCVEGLRPEGPAFEGLLELLGKVREKLPPQKKLGVAAPRWAWDGKESEWQWGQAALGRLGPADYVVVMNRDWGKALRKAEDYSCLTRDMVEALALTLGNRLVVGIPACAATPGHDPAVENPVAAAAGLLRAAEVGRIGGVAVHWYAPQDAGALSPAGWDALRAVITPRVTFAATFGGPASDCATGLQPAPDGGYVLAGWTDSRGSGSDDAWLIKTDAGGREVWSRTFGGAGSDGASAVAATRDGGCLLAGGTESSGSGGKDAWLIKTDPTGREVWSRTLGGAGKDWAYCALEAPDGGYLVAGYTESSGNGGSDAWLLRTDPAGNEVWSRTFGGPGWDWLNWVEPATDGGYILAGRTESFGAGDGDAWVIKIDTAGREAWSRTFGGPRDDRAWCVRPLAGGGCIVAGCTESTGAGGADAWLIKLDSSGKEVWSRTFGGPEDDEANSVQPTADGGYVVAGYTRSFGAGEADAWLISTDVNGRQIWSRTFGGTGEDRAWAVLVAADGGFVLAGETQSFGAGDGDAWLIKTDAAGRVFEGE
ncbi:MAG: hypothetical protein K6T75_00955 [Acetobacteraceae bacterium]|nr:hypothetical protein [Acetobacteraceae bacterium]